MAVKRKPNETLESVSKVLRPEASMLEFGAHMSKMFPIQGWENIPILSIVRPEGSTYKTHEREVEWIDDNGRLQVSRIRTEEHRHVKITAKHFDEKRGSNKWKSDKMHINRIVSHLIDILPRKRREIVVLDHYDMQTTRMLNKICKLSVSKYKLKRRPLIKHTPLLSASQIHVPNPDPLFLDRVSAKNAKLATITQETLLEWINRQDTEDEELVGAFDVLADYCCTWEGDSRCCPSLDMHSMFRKTLLAKKNGVLWLTFSFRGSDANTVRTKVDNWLEREALLFDYSLTLAYTKTYGTVVTMIYVTGRDQFQTRYDYLETLK